MNRKKWLIGAGITVLVGAAIAVYSMQVTQGDPAVNVEKPKKAPFSENVMASGTLESEKVQHVFLEPERGSLDKVLVKPGDKVKEGTPLVQYQSSGRSEIRQAELDLKRAKLNRSQLYRQLKEVQQKGAPTTVSGENGPQAVSEKEIRHQIQLANVEVQQAEERLKQARSNEAKRVVKSQYSGTVIRVNQSSEATQGGGPLVTVADLEELMVLSEVSEYDALKIKEDQKVEIRSDALPDKKWSGTVMEVAPAPEDKNASNGGESQVVYPVKIDLNEKVSVKLGARLIVEITTSTKSALSVPESAVVKQGSNDAVYVVEKGKAYKKKVKIGATDGKRVEIVSGVDAHDKVVTQPPADLSNGAEVKIQ